MGTPQIIFIVLAAMTAGIILTKHGQPRDNYHFGHWIFAAAIEMGLLYWGGFFG